MLSTIRHANTLKRGDIANTLHQQRWKWIGLEPAMRSLHCSGSSGQILHDLMRKAINICIHLPSDSFHIFERLGAIPVSCKWVGLERYGATVV